MSVSFKMCRHNIRCGQSPAWFKQRGHVHQRTTPVGFEPTRGDPIGLAGRRLNRSAKVSLVLADGLKFSWVVLAQNMNMKSKKPNGLVHAILIGDILLCLGLGLRAVRA